MIIAQNLNHREIARRGVLTLVDNLNTLLKKWEATTLPAITAATLPKFAADPKKYYENALLDQAEAKGLTGVDPLEYARLFQISFFPDPTKYTIDTQYLQYVKLKGGTVAPVADYLKQIESIGIVEVTDPAQIEAAQLLLDLFKKFVYVQSVTSGGDMILTKGSQLFGFSFTNQGHLTLDMVNRLAAAMQRTSMEDFEKKLYEQFKNPALLTEPAIF